MVAAPEDRVVADVHMRLDHVVLEDEHVLAKSVAAPGLDVGRDERREGITAALQFLVGGLPELVHLAVADGNEDIDLTRWVVPLEVLDRHDGQAAVLVAVLVLRMACEGAHAVVGVFVKIVAHHFREQSGAHDDHVFHLVSWFAVAQARAENGKT